MIRRTTLRRDSAAGLAAAALAVTALLATAGPVGATPASTPSTTEHAAAAVPALEQAKPTKLADYETQYSYLGTSAKLFTYTTTSRYWSVVGIRPWSGLDIDLRMFADKTQNTLLGSSVFGPGAIDFVAVDSNHRPLGKVFPRVDYYTGAGRYDIQLAQGSDVLGLSAQVIDMDYDVLAVRDTYLHAGTTYRFTVTPSAPGMAAAAYVMDSVEQTPSTWVKSRGQSLNRAEGTAGQPVVLEITPTRDDWYGLVLTSNGYQGSFTVSRTTV